MLLMLVRLLDDEPEAARLVHERFHAFTVDEYQDVNPLQQALLDRWLGGRDELCVVGDDYQTIYTFTGASPEHLLTFPERYPNATIVRLEENYRSSPQVLTVANALARSMGGFEKTLRATRDDGPNPTARAVPDAEAEVGVRDRRGAAAARRRRAVGTDRRALPHQRPLRGLRGGARRRGRARTRCATGRSCGGRGHAACSPGCAGPTGPTTSPRRSRRSPTRSATPPTGRATTRRRGGHAPGRPRPRMRALAAEYARRRRRRGDASPGFLAELEHRFAAEREGRGVQLMTYHRAKGLEFDAVFLPRLLDGELPYRARKSEADPDEERRLLYVGITRAREHLFLSWPREPRSAPSPFLREIGVVKAEAARSAAKARGARAPVTVGAGGGPLFDRLKEWRRQRASTDGVPAYVVFHDATLAEIAERKPRDWADLAAVPGIGPAKLDRYADEVLAIVSSG